MPGIILKRVGEKAREVPVKSKYLADAAREYLSAEYVQRVRLTDTLYLVCDEDGLSKDLPTNFYIAANSKHFPYQRICGDVVFVNTKPIDPSELYTREIYDYETTELSSFNRALIAGLLDELTQPGLEKAYRDFEAKCGGKVPLMVLEKIE